MDRVLPYAAAALLALQPVACSSPTGPVLGDVTSITYMRDGGFAGIHEEVRVGPGSAVTVMRWDSLVTGVLRVDEERRLTAALAGVETWDTLFVTNGCADCFLHRLTIVGSRRTMTVVADDPGLVNAGPGIRATLDVLGMIEQRILPYGR
jgi:hypothetical protein